MTSTDALHRLLDVQDHDASADQLRHRRRTFPERAALEALERRVADMDASLADTAGRRDEVARLQRQQEDELAKVESKLADVQRRLYSGSAGPIRELQAMQAEAEALGRRRSAMEDEVLEAMTQREPLDGEVAGLERERAAIDEEGAKLRAALAEGEAAVDEELAGVMTARAALVESVPDSLLSAYERLRARLDGVGAARLVNGRCDGCHLSLSVTELARANGEPSDAILHCEQCGRILVR